MSVPDGNPRQGAGSFPSQEVARRHLGRRDSQRRLLFWVMIGLFLVGFLLLLVWSFFSGVIPSFVFWLVFLLIGGVWSTLLLRLFRAYEREGAALEQWEIEEMKSSRYSERVGIRHDIAAGDLRLKRGEESELYEQVVHSGGTSAEDAPHHLTLGGPEEREGVGEGVRVVLGTMTDLVKNGSALSRLVEAGEAALGQSDGKRAETRDADQRTASGNNRTQRGVDED